MRILMVVENLPVPFDRRVWSEALALRDAGHSVTVICPTGSTNLPREEFLEGIHVLRHPLHEAKRGALGYLREYLQALWWESRLAWRVWRRQGFDVIHVCNPPDLLFLVALPFKLLGVRVVFDHHDLNPELYVAKFGRRDAFHYLLRLFEWLTFMASDHVISTNESYASVACTRGGKNAGDVTVVRSAPALTEFKALDIPRSPGVTVGYVGVMAEQDGVHLLLRALHELVHIEGHNDISGLLVGDGPSRAELEQLCEELDLTSHVTFTGFLTGDDLMRAMSSFDMGVCPDPVNGYNEYCTMNKVLEYMALGIPVVQFELREGRRSAGAAALYAGDANDPVDLAAAILQLAESPELRKLLGAEGRKRMIEELAWHHQVPKLLNAYRAVSH